MTHAADVVVIGGGIAGCATAWFLSRRGVRVLLVEKECAVAQEQSGRALGHVRQQGRHFLEVPMAMESSRIWGELARDLQGEPQFVRGGVLMLAETEVDESNLSLDADQAQKYGFGAHMVPRARLREILPELAGNWRSGLWSPDDGSTSPGKSTAALAASAQRHGAEIWTSTVATGLEMSGGRITGVQTSRGPVTTGKVVCAAGIWSTRVAAWAGVPLPLQVIRTSLAETAQAEVTTKVAVFTPHVSFRPTLDGTWWIGGGYRGAGVDYDITLSSLLHLRFFAKSYMQNWRNIRIGVGSEFFADIGRRFGRSAVRFKATEPAPNDAIIDYNVEAFRRLMPAQADVPIVRRWAGRIDLTPDLVPALGATCAVEGLFFATGLSGHGIVLGPVVGKLMSEIILDGKSSIDVHALRPDRFAEGKLAPPSLTPEFFHSSKTRKGKGIASAGPEPV